MVQKKPEHIVRYKILYTAMILFAYMIGKGIPLYMIDVSKYLHKVADAESILLQTISGDINRCSIFALGISPYMIGNILVQVMNAFRSAENKSKVSQVKTNKIAMGLTFVIAIVQAFLEVQKLHFRPNGSLITVQVIAGIEMVAGAMIILWLCSRNKRFGIGGQSAIILVNILDGLKNSVVGGKTEDLWVPLAISVVVMMIMIYMENTELRIPVQRVAIHNIYGDKNYMAIKLNPIGVMPAMFSMAFFMVPQMIIGLLRYFYPLDSDLLWWQKNLALDQPVGIAVYIGMLYILAIGFARVFISPKEYTEQFLKSGDSLVNIHAGKDTKRYLSRVITCISMMSATVMCVCLLVPMLLQLSGNISSGFSTLPTSVMMLTGVWCNLYREVAATRDLEAYRPFI